MKGSASGWQSVHGLTVATTAEQVAAQEAVRAFARTSNVIEDARDETGTAWRRVWSPLADLGVFGVAVTEDAGGAGGTLTDLAAMLEQVGHELIPGPVVTTAIGALLCSTAGAPSSFVDAMVTGARPAAISSPQSDAVVRTGDDGRLYLTGTYPSVHGACAESLLILSAHHDAETTWVLVEPDQNDVEVTPLPGVDFASPMGRVVCRDVPVVAEIRCPHGSVDDLHVAGMVAVCSGIARKCLDIATSYAKLREQFGEKIGRFQAIKHLCGEMLCRAEQAAALAWDVASVDADDRPLATAAAAAIALDAAVDNAKDCIQILGATGFTWEHDAHLYLRRALTLRHHAGGSGRWRLRTVERARADGGRELYVDLGEAESDRNRVREDLATVAGLPQTDRQRALADSGYLAPHLPVPHGQAASTAQQVLIGQEIQRAGIERPNLIIGWWAIPTILEAGTPQQLERFIGPTLRGDLSWCQLFSEPGAGSDLASLSTLAIRAPGGWRLNGQKVWPTHAADADWAICLARTDRDVPKHLGITYFLLDMSTPGIVVRPLRAITGEPMLNEVFLDNVFIPDDAVLGQVNDGWRLARSTLANERVEMNTGTLGAPTLNLLALSEKCDDAVVLDKAGALTAQAVANSLLAHRSLLDRMRGAQPGAEASLQKILGVRQRQQVAELTLQLRGFHGVSAGPEAHEFFLTRALSIAGGSAQVLMSLVAERMLGLPR
jgi:alkylation response protein AidB-like acyl-CoA dehydrogenase